MGSENEVDPLENVVEIRTLTEEELVTAWAFENKITNDAMEKLVKEGFCSMAAIKLLEAEDLAKTKIPRGQQKLILLSVNKLIGAREMAGNLTLGDTLAGNGVEAREVPAQPCGAQQAVAHAQQPRLPEERIPEQDGGGEAASDPYLRVLLAQLKSGQLQAQANIPNDGRNTGLRISDNRVSGQFLSGQLGQSDLAGNWRDPQIYLAAASSGKSAPSSYDITDFVSSNVEEEIVVGSNGTQQVILKSGPKKPKLESITLAQWSVANLAILYKLVEDGKLHSGNILDYLSYTTKICQLVQRYSLVSVLLYDKEYRQLQSRHDFRWGTDVPHFQTVHLVARVPKPSPNNASKSSFNQGSRSQTQQSPLTVDGKIICKLYNSKTGCHYKECRYVHSCSHVGCHQTHSAATHHTAKN